MIRLVYFSTAKADIKSADVDKIVEEAAIKNREVGITGALGYNGRNFCQCLEGDDIAVRSLVEAISKDERHSGFKVIDEKEITARQFADWGMMRVEGLDFSVIIDSMRA